MSAHRRPRLLVLTVTLLLALSSGCPSGEPDPDPTPAPGISVSGAHAVQVGETLQLGASTTEGSDAGYSWSSSDASLATVDATGLVTGVAVGELTVTVTGDDTGATAVHPVVVTALPVDPGTPTVAVSGGYYALVGEVVALSAVTTNGDDASYSWSVNDGSVATIDADGLLTGVSPGQVVVTATGTDTGAEGSLGLVVATSVPHLDEWAGSAHADTSAQAFRNWDDDGAVPTSCARCHSSEGFIDYLGGDGSAPGVVDAEGPTGSVVRCETCHHEAAVAVDTVTFPSGDVVEGLGSEARCMTCHQGRASKVDVDQAIADAAPPDDDTASNDLGFVNIHYYAAGATLMAGLARGGYEYDEQVYDVRFRHVTDPNTCVECHSPHSLEVELETCATCHEGVSTVEDLRDVRMMASATVDYDGDGDLSEGIYYEMMGLRDAAMTALQSYATEAGTPVCYDGDAYPYFFNDNDSNGACDATEANYGNRFASWTARMLRGAYNVQVATKDPGAFAHNAKYMIELLYDSAMDLNGALSSPADLSDLRRNDPGHFNGSGQPARYWDENDEVSASCSKCHGGSEGYRFYLEHGVGNEVLEQGNGLDCETCHETFANVSDPADAYSVIEVTSFELASGDSFSEPDDASNICATCHSGRTTGADVDSTLASTNPRFQNVHYLPAAGMRRGGAGNLGYHYPNKDYAEQPDNHLQADGCVFCHDPVATQHSFQPEDSYAAGECAPCHTSVGAVGNIRAGFHAADYDGDGDATEPLADELEGLAASLLAAINAQSGACYDGSSYPYFFNGTNPTGACAAGEVSFGNRYQGWSNAAVSKAAYNYQIWSKEPGAWAHNFDYMAQLLIDSYEDLGGDVTAAGFVRPATGP